MADTMGSGFLNKVRHDRDVVDLTSFCLTSGSHRLQHNLFTGIYMV